MSGPARRFLVIGLDGGTFDLLDPLMAAGGMPVLDRWCREGVSAKLTSVYPAKTLPAWYSLATGLDPGALGIFGFTEPDGGPGRSRIVMSYRPHEAIWDLLSRQGRSVGVINFPLRAGYPVNGFFLPGMFSDRPRTYPVELARQLDRVAGGPYLPELPPYRPNDRARWMAMATEAVRQRAAVTRAFTDRFRPDFLFVLFRETDRIEHQHWSEMAGLPRGLPEDLRLFWSAVDTACGEIDEGFRSVGGEAVTLVVSDHGHGAAGTEFFTNRWLAEEGYLRFKGGSESVRRRLASWTLLAADRAPPLRRLLRPFVDRLQGNARGEQLAQIVTGDASFEAMTRRIDWERTEAYSYPVPEGIYLNPYRDGLTEERRGAIVEEIRAKLARFPGARIEAFEPRSIYRSVNHPHPPVLLLRINGLETESRMDFAYPEPLLQKRPEFFYGSGIHRMDGILIAHGSGVADPGQRGGDRSLLDVAPTVLEGMGVPVPREMVGRSFVDLLGRAE